MEETYNSELLITQEITQPTIETLAPRQEAQETQKHEEKKMSEIDLSKFSLEVLQAALEKKKAEEAKTKFELDENDPSNLVKWLFTVKAKESLGAPTSVNDVVDYPGKLTKFVFMYDENDNATTDPSKALTVRIVSAFEDNVINGSVRPDLEEMVLAKI